MLRLFPAIFSTKTLFLLLKTSTMKNKDSNSSKYKESFIQKSFIHVYTVFLKAFSSFNMSFSFQTKVASRGFHVFKNTIWENAKMGEEISVQIETNEASKMIDPCCCTIKALISGKLETVVHILGEISFFLLEKRERT